MPDAAARLVPYAITFGVIYAAFKTLGYWLVPILTRAAPRCASALPTTFVPVEDVATLDRPLQMGLNRIGMELAALGFAATPPMRDASGKLKGVVQLHTHPVDGNIASIIVMPVPYDEDGFVSLFFASQTASGTRIVTTNSPLPSVYPPQPGIRGVRFPGETKAARLYALHQAHARTAGRLAPMHIGDPAVWQRREEERSARWWQECGYCFRQGDDLRHTWKGAFMTVWRLQAPLKGRAERRDEAVRQSLLGAAGLPA